MNTNDTTAGSTGSTGGTGKTVRLVHSHATGTLALGTARGDGSAEVLKGLRWRWSRNIITPDDPDGVGGAWYVPRSRDRLAKHWEINAAAEALRAAGFHVDVQVDESAPRPPAEVEQDRADRLAARAERLGARADRHAGITEDAWAASKRISDSIPLGQPILVGHHSERGHRRDIDRMNRLDRKGLDAHRVAEDAARRAAQLEADPEARHTPHAVQARLERIATDLRGVIRTIGGSSHNFGGGYVEAKAPATGQYLARLEVQRADLEAQRDYWQTILDQLQANGAVVYSRDNVAKGDEVLHGGRWLRVVRANAKTVTLPSPLYPAWTGTTPYHQLRGLRGPDHPDYGNEAITHAPRDH